MSIFLP